MESIQKVVSQNFFLDIVVRLQNMFGMNLTFYEKMIKKGINQVEKEIKERNLSFRWYRYEITQLTNGAVAILLYGDLK